MLSLAMKIARAEFDRSIQADGVGVAATLKRRNTALPASSGSVRSPAFGSSDFAASDYKARYEDPSLYSASVSIQLAFEKPSQLMAAQPVALLEGQTVAYVPFTTNAKEGDVIICNEVYYDVVSARPSSPSLCQLLTLKRIN